MSLVGNMMGPRFRTLLLLLLISGTQTVLCEEEAENTEDKETIEPTQILPDDTEQPDDGNPPGGSPVPDAGNPTDAPEPDDANPPETAAPILDPETPSGPPKTAKQEVEDGAETEDTAEEDAGDEAAAEGDTAEEDAGGLEDLDPADPDDASPPETTEMTSETESRFFLEPDVELPPDLDGTEGSSNDTSEATVQPEQESSLDITIILIPVVLLLVIIAFIVLGILIWRRCQRPANRELSKEDPFLDGSSTEKVPMPMFEEDVPSVLELEMEELDQWMKKDG